jgi:hypothetical protein
MGQRGGVGDLKKSSCIIIIKNCFNVYHFILFFHEKLKILKTKKFLDLNLKKQNKISLRKFNFILNKISTYQFP